MKKNIFIVAGLLLSVGSALKASGTFEYSSSFGPQYNPNESGGLKSTDEDITPAQMELVNKFLNDVDSNKVNAVKDCLINNSFLAYTPNKYGVWPLSIAVSNNNTAMVTMLLKAGANPNTSIYEDGDSALSISALSIAVSKNNPTILDLLHNNIKNRTNIGAALMNAVIAYGAAQLYNAAANHSAVSFGPERVALEMYYTQNQGLPVTATSAAQSTPTGLSTAETAFTTALAAAKTANALNVQCGSASMTALMMAVRFHSPEMVTALINAGASTSIANNAVNWYLSNCNQVSSTDDNSIYTALTAALNPHPAPAQTNVPVPIKNNKENFQVYENTAAQNSSALANTSNDQKISALDINEAQIAGQGEKGKRTWQDK